MMKRLGYLFLLLVVSSSLWAQPRLHEPEIYVGMHGGALFSMALFTPQVAGTSNWVDRTLLSGNGGLVFRYSGHKHCAFQLEVDYMQRGWREIAKEDGCSVNYQRRLNYIEVPFLAHLNFGKKVRFFFNLGPQFGWCFSESWSGTQHPDTAQQHQYGKIDNRFDWGLTGGLGMLVRTNKVGTFQLEARFSYSLGDYFANSRQDYFTHSNPICLSANVGYLWEIKRKR